MVTLTKEFVLIRWMSVASDSIPGGVIFLFFDSLDELCVERDLKGVAEGVKETEEADPEEVGWL